MEAEGMERPPSFQSEMPHIEGMSAKNKMFTRLRLHICAQRLLKNKCITKWELNQHHTTKAHH